MKIILGSTSEGRKIVMKELGFEFETMSPDIDEKAIRKNNPRELVMAIAQAKADILVPKIKEPAFLIVSDQVVLYEGKIREKPIDETQARAFLESYANAFAETVGAVVVVNTKTGKRAGGLQQAKVHFRPFPKAFIDEYIKTGGPFKGAGGVQVHDPILKPFIERIEGSFDSLTGLSKDLVKKLIKEVSGK